MPALRRQQRWQRCAASNSDAVQTATAALCSQRQRRCADSGAGSAVQPAAAALCRQRCWQRCASSDAGAAGTATLTALCSQRQRRCADSGAGSA
eukprot:2704669-Pleurochrysis_carterae.AAC.1